MNFFQKVKLFSQIVRSAFRNVFLSSSRIQDVLSLTGNISEIEILKDSERNVIKTIAKATMEITNQSDVTVNLINPKYFRQSNWKHFALTEEDAKVKLQYWCSSEASDEPIISDAFNEILGMLEERKSVENLTVTLLAGEKTVWEEKIVFEFDATEKKKRWEEINWNDFRKKSDAFWFNFSYYLPEEIYLIKPKLSEILPECWKCAGEMPMYCYKNESGEVKVFNIDTKPIFIDFTQAKTDESK